MRARSALAVLAGAALLVSAAPAQAARKKTIHLGDNYFAPATVKVSKNTVVTWKWPSFDMAGDVHDVKLKSGPAGVKKFLARDFKNEGTEASEANVKAWLDENGADFGYDPNKATQTTTSTSETSQGQQVATDLEDEDGQPIDSNLPPEVQQALALVQRFESGQLSQNQGAVDVVKSQLSDLEGKNLSAKETADQLRALGIPMAGY